MRRFAYPVLALLVLVAGACAPGTNAAMQGGEAGGPNAQVLTAEDLAPFAGQTLFEAINTSNRQWLRAQFEDPVKVWLDGREMGGTGELRTILVSQVAQVQYYMPRDAIGEFGVGHTSGAIAVTSR